MSDAAPVMVRTARPSELAAAGACVRAAYEADGLADPAYLDVIADARARARTDDVLVAVDAHGELVGSVTLVAPGSPWSELSKPGEAEFRMLGVTPAARGHGVARALVGACLARAAERGARRVVICSAVTMTAAHRLYDGFGFVRARELDWAPDPDVHLLGFALDLPAAPASRQGNVDVVAPVDLSRHRPTRLVGHGLVLREWGQRDLEVMPALFDYPDIALRTPLPSPFTAADATDRLARAAQSDRLLLAVTTDGRQPLGEVLLTAGGELGYMIGHRYRGQGLATRALLLLRDHAHDAVGLAVLHLTIEPDNDASRAVARRAGFRLSRPAARFVQQKGRECVLDVWEHVLPEEA